MPAGFGLPGGRIFLGLMGALQIRTLKTFDRAVVRTLYRSLLSRRLASRNLARSQPPPDPATIRRMLVIRPGGIGDAVLFFPMLQALRQAFPQAGLDVLAERRNVDLFAANDVVDSAWAYDASFGLGLLKGLRGRYDLVVDTEQYHMLSALIAAMTKAPVRCGFDTQGRGGLFTHRVRYSDQVYEVYSFLDLVTALTGRPVEFDVDRPFFPVSEAAKERARARLEERLPGSSTGGIVVISPGASMRQRIWAPERYRELANWLLQRGHRIAVIGSPADRAAATAVAEGLPADRVASFAGTMTLADTAGLITFARLYVSSDTGPLHIAYGVGVPTVHLFGSGILEKWAPAGSRTRAVTGALACSPCTRYGYTPPCPYDVECMKRIEAADVIARVEESLAERTGPRA
jgi:lipopolysaccharide heptosyltransferase II